MSFGALAQRIAALRGDFGALGIVRGDIVAYAALDRLECLAALAVLPAACTFARSVRRLTLDAYVELLERLAPTAVLVPPRIAAMRSPPPSIASASTRIAMVPDRAGEAGAFDLRFARSPRRSTRAARRAPLARSST